MSARILIFHPYLKARGGCEKLIMEYLSRTKFDADLYTFIHIKDRSFKEFENFNVIELRNGWLTKRYVESFFTRGLVFSIYGMLTKLPVRKYDALLISAGGFADLLSLKNKLEGRTFMYCHTPLRVSSDVHDIKWVEKQMPRKKLMYFLARKMYSLVEKLAWKRYDFVFFNSNLSRNRAITKNLTSIEKTDVVYPGVDLPEVTSSTSYGNYIIYVSRYGTAKRQLELLDAWKKFYERYEPDLTLVLVGSSTKKHYYLKVVRKASKIKGVEVYADVSNEVLNEIYGSAIAGLNLAWREDFGIVPFEVLAYGKPLITVDGGGFMELIKDAPSMIVIKDTLNEEKFINRVYNALVQFWRNKDYYLDKAKQNQKFVKSLNLSWDRFARELDEKIERLIGR